MGSHGNLFFQRTFWAGKLEINAFALSRKGSGRDMNQDRFIVETAGRDQIIAAIADGMGGETGGKIAANMAVEGISTFYKTGADAATSLAAAIKKIDRTQYNYSRRTPGFEKMGTTLTCLVIKPYRAHFAHVGDTRLYLFRDHSLCQITKDHTLVENMVLRGEVTRKQKKGHYLGHVLSQCVGRGRCEPQTGSFDLFHDDLLVLSSDGIHKVLEKPALELVLNSNDTLPEKAGALVYEADRSFGTDDMTVVLVQI
jgi:serine/threonine protein phosphatase PrpC